MPAKIILTLQLLFLLVGWTSSVTANVPSPEDTDSRIFMPGAPMTDTIYGQDPDKLRPLQWDYVKQDYKIEHLLNLHREAMKDQRGIPGYRVHIYMDSGNRARLHTQHQQAEFEKKFPEQRSYIVYEEPYFKLRAGDFRTRFDARRFLEKIRRHYPAAYIVVDRINYPEMD